MSNQLTAEIQRANSLTTVRKSATVYHDEIDPQNFTDDDNNIHCLKAAQGKGWASEKKPPQAVCVGCDGNHPQATCRFKNVNCQCCGKKGHLARVCRAAQPAAVLPARQPYAKTSAQTAKAGRRLFFHNKNSRQAKSVIGQASLARKKKIHLIVKL